MLQTVAHINLAKGFRGGERQSVLLMKYLKLRNPELKQFLICRPGGEIQKYVTDIPDLTIIEAKALCLRMLSLDLRRKYSKPMKRELCIGLPSIT